MRASADEEIDQKNQMIERLTRQLDANQAAVIVASDADAATRRASSTQCASHNFLFKFLTRDAAGSTHKTLADLLLNDEAVFSEAVGQARHESEVNLLASQLSSARQALADSDQKAQRLAQTEKMLREEVERLSRNESRTMHNLEYLKNLVIKFMQSDAVTAKVLFRALY